MTDTTNLGLPYIEASQAQKHVTHNEALRILDAAIQIAVLDMNRTAPPSAPADGERHVVAASPTADWAGHGNAIATWQDGAWTFLTPSNGWCVWSIADASLKVFDGTVWRDLRGLALDNASHIGVNTTASSPNLLSVKSNAALFAAINAADGGSGDMRLQVSKETAAKTASVYFSDAYSGRAEFGLVGSDAFKLKVSPDGSAWTDALGVDQATGNATLPRGLALTGLIAPPQITANQNDYAPTGFAAASVVQVSTDAARSLSGLAGGSDGRVVSLINTGAQMLTLLDDNASSLAANRFAFGGNIVVPARQAVLLRYDGNAARWQALARPQAPGRDVLTANRTYYVSTTGSDGNTGLASTPAGAFLTVQHALDVAASIDFNGFAVTINIGAGTFPGGFSVPAMTGQSDESKLVIVGAGSTTILTSSQAYVGTINVSGVGARATLGNLKVQNTMASTGVGIIVNTNGVCRLAGGVEIGAADYCSLQATGGAFLYVGAGLTLSANATYPMLFDGGCTVVLIGGTVAFGTRSVTVTMVVQDMSYVTSNSVTYTGTVTGQKYAVATNAVLQTFGALASIPGSTAGTVTSGGIAA